MATARRRPRSATGDPGPLQGPRIAAGIATSAGIVEGPGSGTDWRSVHVTGDTIAGEIDGLDLAEVQWSGARLTGSRLRRVHAADVLFSECDLSGVVFEAAHLTRVRFQDCRLSGVVLAGAVVSDLAFSGCRLDGASFRQVRGRRLHISDSDLRGADFAGADISGLRMTDCNLDGSVFTQATLPGVRLHGSSIVALSGVAHLAGCVIDEAQAPLLGLQLLAALGISITDRDGAD